MTTEDNFQFARVMVCVCVCGGGELCPHYSWSVGRSAQVRVKKKSGRWLDPKLKSRGLAGRPKRVIGRPGIARVPRYL